MKRILKIKFNNKKYFISQFKFPSIRSGCTYRMIMLEYVVAFEHANMYEVVTLFMDRLIYNNTNNKNHILAIGNHTLQKIYFIIIIFIFRIDSKEQNFRNGK